MSKHPESATPPGRYPYPFLKCSLHPGKQRSYITCIHVKEKGAKVSQPYLATDKRPGWLFCADCIVMADRDKKIEHDPGLFKRYRTRQAQLHPMVTRQIQGVTMTTFAPNIPPSVQELYEHTTGLSGHLFSLGHQIRPTILFSKHGKQGVAIIPTMANTTEKDCVAKMINNFRKDCEIVAFLTEVWMFRAKSTEEADAACAAETLETVPGRIECVAITFYLPKNRQILVAADIHRNPDRLDPWRVHGDTGDGSKSCGRFATPL